jgi:hypothetical protein
MERIVLLLLTATAAATTEYLQNTYRDSESYAKRYLLDSPYNLCREPLMKTAGNVSATSVSRRQSGSSALHSSLWGGSAWTADRSDFSQALIVDLGAVRNVTGIATQGRAHTKEFVIEYRIQYGSNGRDWIDYKEVGIMM